MIEQIRATKISPHRNFCLKINFWSRESLDSGGVVGIGSIGVADVVVGCDVIVKAKKANFVEEKNF